MDCSSESHKMHICALKTEGRHDLVELLTSNPTVECRQCGARANDIKNICAAHMGENAPNVEGGHGSVSLGEIGKPHAGRKNEGR